MSRKRIATLLSAALVGVVGCAQEQALDTGAPPGTGTSGAALGTPAALVRDIDSTTQLAESSPGGFVAVNGKTLFGADDGIHGRELWVTDGTEGGTRLLKDIRPGRDSSSMSNFRVINGTLYFAANDGVSGSELWRSDGTVAGTYRVKDLQPGLDSSYPDYFTDVNGTLFFGATGGLWKSDGTEAGTVLVAPVGIGQNVAAVNGRLFFTSSTSAAGLELWVSNGTAAGTFMVKDISPGVYNSSPDNFLVVGSTLFFQASDLTAGQELWKSDGTAAGTVRVKDIKPGSAGGYPTYLAAMGGIVYFSADDGTHGTELWRSDGTAAGTYMVKDLQAGASGSNPYYMTAAGNVVYFQANVTGGQELWRTDGTADGTYLLKDVRPGSSSSYANYFKPIGSRVYFQANDGVSGREVWTTDGTTAGTQRLKDIFPGTGESYIWGVMGEANGVIYLQADDGQGAELWRTDGTEAGTVKVKDIHPGVGKVGPLFLTGVGNTLFFNAGSSKDRELWKSDGTYGGTVQVKDIYPGYSTGSSPSLLTGLNGSLYFVANDGVSGSELWKSDGTTAGTVMVSDLYPGSSGGVYSSTGGLTALEGMLYFAGIDSASGLEPRRSDGTSAGTVLVADVNPGWYDSGASQFTSSGGVLYFTASDGTTGVELWRRTATGVARVKDIFPGTTGSGPRSLTDVGGVLFFVAEDAVSGVELWKSDGTAAGTVRVKDISPGVAGSWPESLTVLNGVLYFTAHDGVSGLELWRSDGSEAGTVRVKDLLPGPGDSRPELLTVVGGALYFVADDGVSGRELWKSDGTEAGTVLLKELTPGVSGSSFGMLWALQPEGVLLFSASDGMSGVELWRSDGTAAGTVMAQDLAPGAGSSFPYDFTRVGGRVFFTADNGSSGRELWSAQAMDLADGQAPTVTCPANIQQEASGTTTYVSYAATVTDNSTPVPSPTYVPSNRYFPLGTTTVTASATDKAGNTGSCSFTVTLRDTRAPVLFCPSNVVAEATSSAGAVVSYSAAYVSEAVTYPLQATYSQPSGSQFPMGTTTVTASATDDAGNTGTCSFTVTVRDTKAPVLTCPGNVVTEATSSAGAVVSYPEASASDAVTPSLQASYSLPSGGVFPMGATTVKATARDAAGNTGTCSFTVTVRDTTPPVVSCPAGVVTEATSSEGAVVSYPEATASDAVTPLPQLGYSQPSGGTFPLGTTTVTATARDSAGNTGTCSFTVTVQDTTPPVVSCPADVLAEATSSEGAAVSYPEVSVSDVATLLPRTRYTLPSGGTFPLGTTTVTATVQDAGGNTGTCSFSVTVRDTTPPVVKCRGDLSVPADSYDGAFVVFPPAGASDLVSSAVVTYTPASGDFFPVGETRVTVSAVDAVGNEGSCTFLVTVVP